MIQIGLNFIYLIYEGKFIFFSWIMLSHGYVREKQKEWLMYRQSKPSLPLRSSHTWPFILQLFFSGTHLIIPSNYFYQERVLLCLFACILGWLVGFIGLPLWLSGKESSCNAGATGDGNLIPGLGRSPGGGNGNPHQYSCLENPGEQRSLVATVHGVAKSQIWLKWLRMHACIFLKHFFLFKLSSFSKYWELPNTF